MSKKHPSLYVESSISKLRQLQKNCGNCGTKIIFLICCLSALYAFFYINPSISTNTALRDSRAIFLGFASFFAAGNESFLIFVLGKYFNLDTEMRDKFPYKLARLVKPKNKAQRWYIVFYSWNLDTQKFCRYRDYSVNKFSDVAARNEFAKKFIMAVNEKLILGVPLTLQEANNTIAPPKVMSITEAIDFAIAAKISEFKPRTIEVYKNVVNIFGGFLKKNKIENIPVAALGRKEVHAFLDDVINVRQAGNTTRNNYLQFLKAMFNVLIERQILDKNPCAGIKRLQSNGSKNMAYTTQQQKQLFEYMGKNEPNLLNFVKMMMYTFVRPTEIRSIQLKEIFLNEQQIVIPSNKSKNKKTLAVALPAAIMEYLNGLNLQEYPAEFYLFGRQGKPAARPVSENFFAKRHLQMLRELGYHTDYTLYSWKHTGVCLAYKAGIDIKSLQKQLRHSSLAMTDIYLRSLALEDNNVFLSKMPNLL